MSDSAHAFDHITAGFIMSELVAWELKLPKDHPAHGEGIPQNWLMGALWLLSDGITKAISNSGMEWEDGVFEYDHCANNEASVWLPVVNRMTYEDWYKLAGSNILPEWLDQQVTLTMKELGLL